MVQPARELTLVGMTVSVADPSECPTPPPDAGSIAASAAASPPASRRATWFAPAEGWGSILRKRPGDPGWAFPALLVLLATTGVLYLWGLGSSGWANAYYAAAVQAGATSWKAFFFGAFDSEGFITVDKPPASLWVMALSARVFGVNSWSMLVPQALAGVATVAVLVATVRRWCGPVAGLLAGLVAATMPVAVLMFRFNNPDALLVLLMTLGAYCLVRAVETANPRWLALVGVTIGFGFLTKMLQALLVLPVFAVVYLVAAPTSLRRRLGHLLLAGFATVAAGGWWVAIVELVPASDRPYIGGSQHNSILELTLGYNGLGRLTGEETGSVGGPSAWGTPGWSRLFGDDMGGQASWLLPAALILLLAGLASTARAPRTDRGRAAWLLWGGWLLVNVLTFSFMQGIIHAYYTVALAPAIGALVGIGVASLLARRSPLASTILAATVLVTAGWAYQLLGRTPDWHPYLRTAVVAAGTIAALAAAAGAGRVTRARAARLLPGAIVVFGLFAGLCGPVAYAAQTASTPHTGSIPSAGPGAGHGPGGTRPGGAGPGGTRPATDGQFGNALPPGGPGSQGSGAPTGGGQDPGATERGGQGPGQGFPGGGQGGLLNATTPSAELVATLSEGADAYTWILAAVGANSSAGYQLATDRPVMAIGGFNGSDPAPTLAQFQQYVADRAIHYFLGGGQGMRPDSGDGAGQQISEWVQSNFTAMTVGETTLYDLTTPAAS